MSQVVYQAVAYPGFSSIKQPGVYFHLVTTPWMGCKSMAGLIPAPGQQNNGQKYGLLVFCSL